MSGAAGFLCSGEKLLTWPTNLSWQFLLFMTQDSRTVEIFGEPLKTDLNNKRLGGKSSWREAASQTCSIGLGKSLIHGRESPAISGSFRLFHSLGINAQDPAGFNK